MPFIFCTSDTLTCGARLILEGLFFPLLSHFSHVQLCVTPWTIARQAPLSMGSSREEYWSGLPCPPPGDLTNPGAEPSSLLSPVLADRLPVRGHKWPGWPWRDCPSQVQITARDGKYLTLEHIFQTQTNQFRTQLLYWAVILSHSPPSLIHPRARYQRTRDSPPAAEPWNDSNQPVLSWLALSCLFLPKETTAKAPASVPSPPLPWDWLVLLQVAHTSMASPSSREL